MKYSRKRYNDILCEALSSVDLEEEEGTNQLKMVDLSCGTAEEFTRNYVNAMLTIFNRIWSRACESFSASENPNSYAICKKAVDISGEIIKDMSICIVLTESEEDANKLFEVLNDRSLTVEDLELIKNHFYKEYCTKSNDSDVVKDQNIAQLDEIWTDKTFSENTEKKLRLISYLAAVYLTKDKDLSYKDDSKLKDIIDKKYTAKEYSLSAKQYNKDCILSDFNAYFAMKIIINEVGLVFSKTKVGSLNAEQENRSITYKTLHLLNAMDYVSVMPALTNLILSTYASKNDMSDNVNFEDSFKNYVIDLIEDATNNKTEYLTIHRCAYMLWISTVKAKDFNKPRQIASRIIEKCGRDLQLSNVDFTSTEVKELNHELDSWLGEWTYNSNRTFIIKILLFHLLNTNRDNIYDYKSNSVKLGIGKLNYKLKAAKLQLDHLEAKEFNSNNKKAYFLSSDKEKRDKIVNGYLGNFMILDEVDNNAKNNVPLTSALKYYSGISNSWMIKDIDGMLKDPTYSKENVPKEEFFDYRSKQLKAYFKAYLSIDLGQGEFNVNF